MNETIESGSAGLLRSDWSDEQKQEYAAKTGRTYDPQTGRWADIEFHWDKLPLPFSCDVCDNEALYAAHGKQYCATCWQNRRNTPYDLVCLPG